MPVVQLQVNGRVREGLPESHEYNVGKQCFALMMNLRLKLTD